MDNMFVIVSGLDGLTKTEKELQIPECIGAALKHAGVSIMVTSFTDVMALGIGVTTVSSE